MLRAGVQGLILCSYTNRLVKYYLYLPTKQHQPNVLESDHMAVKHVNLSSEKITLPLYDSNCAKRANYFRGGYIGYNDCRDLNKFQQKFPVKKTVITSEWKSSFIH